MAEKDKRRKKILITLAGGGYLWQSTRLIKRMEDAVDFFYVTGDDCMVPPKFAESEVHFLKTIHTMSTRHRWQALANLAIATFQACIVIFKTKPDAIVCVAVPLSIPLAIAGKFFNKKFIFIDSITRVTHPSRTGRILDKFALADRIYVQWPELARQYKNAIYRGSVL